jgi:hypothetical protein
MSMRGKTQSAETKAKIADTLRARMTDPAVRAKISTATKARMADPAVRQRIRDGMAAAAGDLVSLTILRSAWQGAPPGVRRRFMEELLAPLFKDAADRAAALAITGVGSASQPDNDGRP